MDVDVISVVFQKPEDRNTWVVAAKGKLKVGQSYMITVNHSDKVSYFTQSAKNGIIPISDTAKVDEIRALCEAASE